MEAISDVEDLRKSLGSDKITLLGHSWGGILAMAYTAQHPEHVGGLLLLCSGGPTSEYYPLFHNNLHGRLTPVEEASVKQAATPFASFKALWPGYLYDRSSLPAMDAFFKPEYYYPDVADIFEKSIENYDFALPLRTFAGPVFILNGERDPIDPSTARQIHDLFKNSSLSFIPKTGHYPWIEQPGTFYSYLEQALNYLDGHNP